VRRTKRTVFAAALLVAAGAARAESGLAVPVPDPLGVFRGLVHDRSGRVIGENVVENRRHEDGRVVLRSEAQKGTVLFGHLSTSDEKGTSPS
jgi:hypothetical protein